MGFLRGKPKTSEEVKDKLLTETESSEIETSIRCKT